MRSVRLPEPRHVTASDGCRLGIRDLGVADGDVLVLLHSLGTDSTMWEPCAAQLSRTHRIVLPDSRGHGASAPAPQTSVDQWADDLATVVEATGARDVVMVGVSMGGIQALAYAATRPPALRGLVVADSFASLPTEVAAEKIASFADQVRTRPMADVAAAYVADTFRSPPPAAADAVLRAMSGLEADSFMAAVTACFGARIEDRLPHVDVPVRLLWGEHDAKTPRALSEAIRRQLPESDLTDLGVLDDAGHLSNVDNPEGFAAEVRRFCDALSERADSQIQEADAP